MIMLMMIISLNRPSADLDQFRSWGCGSRARAASDHHPKVALERSRAMTRVTCNVRLKEFPRIPRNKQVHHAMPRHSTRAGTRCGASCAMPRYSGRRTVSAPSIYLSLSLYISIYINMYMRVYIYIYIYIHTYIHILAMNIIIIMIIMIIMIIISLIIIIIMISCTDCGQSPNYDSGLQRICLQQDLKFKGWNSQVRRGSPGESRAK